MDGSKYTRYEVIKTLSKKEPDMRLFLFALLMSALQPAVFGLFAADENTWRSFVIPCPKEMHIKGTIDAPNEKIKLEIFEEEHFIKESICGQLKNIALCNDDSEQIRIKIFSPVNMPEDKALLLKKLKNSSQAYLIDSVMDNNKLKLNVYSTSYTGAFYACITLKQLLENGRRISPHPNKTTVPVLQIKDWPDIEERGIWGNQKIPGNDLEWYSKWKMNMISQSAQPFFDIKTGRALLGFDKAAAGKAAKYGIRFIPHIPHLNSIEANAGLHKAFSRQEFSALRNALATPDPAKKDVRRYGVCSSSKEFKALLTAWLMEAARYIQPYHNEIEVWVSEMGKCFCPSCAGKDQFLLDTKCITEAFKDVSTQFPRLRLRIWTSQNAYPKTSEQMKYIGDGIGLSYYHGSNSYVTDRNPMIYSLLEKEAAGGKFIGVVPQFSHDIRAVVPFTCPEFVRFRMNEFADKNIASVASFNVISRHFNEFNLMAEAEWGWNSKGRSMDEFAKAYAVSKNLKDPELFSKWVVLINQPNYDLAESRFFCRLNENPDLNMFDKMEWDFYFRHSSLIDRERLEKDVKMAEEALDVAHKLTDIDLQRESVFVLASLEAFKDLRFISNVIKSENVNVENRKQLEVAVKRLDRNSTRIKAVVIEWAKDSFKRSSLERFGIMARLESSAFGLANLILKLKNNNLIKSSIANQDNHIGETELARYSSASFKNGNVKLDVKLQLPVAQDGDTLYIFPAPCNGTTPRIIKSVVYCKDKNGGDKEIEIPPESGFFKESKTRAYYDISKYRNYTITRIKLELANNSASPDCIVYVGFIPQNSK